MTAPGSVLERALLGFWAVVDVYGVGPGITKTLLAGALAIEVAAALCAGALVWMGFIFMTELFVAYTAESPFRELLMLTLGTVLVVVLVPDD